MPFIDKPALKKMRPGKDVGPTGVIADVPIAVGKEGVNWHGRSSNATSILWWTSMPCSYIDPSKRQTNAMPAAREVTANKLFYFPFICLQNAFK